MRLSANTCICEYLRRGEDEAEREHWYLRVSERRRGKMRLSVNTGICEYLRGGEYEPEREH
jgi:hypothetical protein